LSKSTRATKALEQAGAAFSVHAYDYDPDADKIGMQAAKALGEAPQRVLKTLIALVDGKPVCVVLRSDREVSMKKLAAALGDLQRRLETNRRLLSTQLKAARAVSDIITQAIRDSQSDGTYSDRYWMNE